MVRRRGVWVRLVGILPVIILVGVLSCAGLPRVYALSQGPNNGSSFAWTEISTPGDGSVAWYNTGNARYADGSFASTGGMTSTAPYNYAFSGFLQAFGFGFTIPDGSTITGYQVDFLGYATGSDVRVMAAGPASSSIPGPGGHENVCADLGGGQLYHFSTSPQWFSFGGPTTKGGCSATPAQIRDPSFGVFIIATNDEIGSTRYAYIDNMRMTIYYTPPPVSITISSSTAGSGFVTVDGTPITTPQTYSWVTGSTHTIAASSTNNIVAGQSRYAYTSWSDGGAQSHTYTVPSSPETVTASFHTEYNFVVSSAYDTPTGAGWYDSGTSVTSTVTRPAACGAGCQEDTIGFSGTGNAPSSSTPGVSTTGPFTLNQYSTVTWNWGAQYQHTITSSPSTGSGFVKVDSTPQTTPYTTPWWNSGSSHTIEAMSPVGGAPGRQYVWTGWSDIGAQSHTIAPTSITTYTANYKTQYQLTISISPVGGGTTTPAAGSYWYDSGTSVSVDASPAFGYAFSSWSDGGAQTHQVTMSQARSVTANFAEQTVLTVNYAVAGGGSPTAPTLHYVQGGADTTYDLTLTPTPVACDPNSAWFVTPNPLGGSSSSEQWYSVQQLSGTAGSSQSMTFTYTHQYYIGVVSPYGSPTISGWANSGDSYPTSVTSPDGQHACSGYVIDANPLQPSTSYTFTNIQAAHNIEYQWILNSIVITVTSNPTGSGFVRVDDTSYSTPHDFSWVVGSHHTLEALSPTSGAAGVQYVWIGWSDIGAQTHQYTVPSSPATVTANYATQYRLTIATTPPGGGGDTTPAAGTYWHDSGENVALSASPTSDYMFASWSDGGAQSHTVVMDQARAVTATFIRVDVMTVNYQIGGGGSPTPPTLTCFQGGSAHQLVLSETATPITCDTSTEWSVAPNPLDSSGLSERWHSNDPLSGPVATQAITFSFQHQYYLTTEADPSSGGSALPASGWQDSGASIGITASTNPGYIFQSWTGTGTGSYSGQDSPSTVTMDSAITETANFGGGGNLVTLTVNYTIIGAGSGYSAPTLNYVQGGIAKTCTLTNNPTGILADSGSAWSVVSNPLGGSTSSEQWYSGQTLSGTASTQTIEFAFQHRYTLTMTTSPVGGGSTTPITGWQNAGTTVSISATINPGYNFQDWSGSGSGSYSGSDNPASITVSEPTAETAEFAASGPTRVTMTVSYSVAGNGVGYSAPVFNYVQGGVSMQAILNQTAGGIQCDIGSSWLVTSNPLIGSTTSERWYSVQSLGGTVAEQTLVFSFQHQYYLTMQVSPPSGGSTSPVSGWQNAGASVVISAAAGGGYTFQSWTGSGTGSYSGADNPASTTVSGAITEQAAFSGSGTPLGTSICTFTNSTSSIEGGGYYEGAIRGTAAYLPPAALLVGVVGQGSMLSRGRLRWLRKHTGQRGGLSQLASILMIITLVAVALVGLSFYYTTISAGATSHSDLILAGSEIEVNIKDDSGAVYLKMYNPASTALKVASIVISGLSPFAINFTDGRGEVPSGWTCVISGGRAGIGGSSPNSYLSLAAGATISIRANSGSGITTYFIPTNTYGLTVTLSDGPELPFDIPCRSYP